MVEMGGVYSFNQSIIIVGEDESEEQSGRHSVASNNKEQVGDSNETHGFDWMISRSTQIWIFLMRMVTPEKEDTHKWMKLYEWSID